MDRITRDKNIYNLARFFLTSRIKGIEVKIDEYLQPEPRPNNIQGVYKRLLESAQNSGSMPNVIGGSIKGGLESLSTVLFGFEPSLIAKRYPNRLQSKESLLYEIKSNLEIAGKMNAGTHALWPRFCGSIIDGAKFLSQFRDVTDFFDWIDFFDKDNRAREGLPLLLKQQIHGFGIALSCDFLKELGYVNFGKPDVHLKEIFTKLDISDSDDDLVILNAIRRVADNNSVTPYAVDKTFWLIGSGFFYHHPSQIGKNGKIPRPKAKFIEFAKQELKRI